MKSEHAKIDREMAAKMAKLPIGSSIENKVIKSKFLHNKVFGKLC